MRTFSRNRAVQSPTGALTRGYALYRLSSMGNQPRMSAQTIKVLGALMSSSSDELSGADIGRATKLASGTLYPILARLEQAGWFESRWESEQPQALGRPRRRLYRITAIGMKNASATFRDLLPAFGRVAWA
jgi:PadR family transcriptional regulator PadR